MFSLKHIVSKSIIAQPRALSPGAIGMDIGIDSIHLCQLQPLDGRRYTVLAKASLPFSGTRGELLESPKQLKQLIHQGLKRGHFSGRQVVTVMPPDQLKIIPVTYRAHAREVDQAILKILEGRLEGDLSDYLIDYIPVRSNTENEESLALATVTYREDVNRYLDVLTRCGLKVSALDVGPAAIRRLVCTLYADDDQGVQTVLVINAGVSRSYLTIISGRRLLFDQPVKFGEAQLFADLSNSLDLSEEASRELIFRYGIGTVSPVQGQHGDMSDDEVSRTLLQIVKPAFVKLVEEINRVLIFTASETHGQPITRVCILGSMARWPGAMSLLRQLIDIPFQTNQQAYEELFVDKEDDDAPLSEQIPELAVATGLALRGIMHDG